MNVRAPIGLATALVVGLGAPPLAAAGPGPSEIGELSEQGARRGALEFGLGGVLSGAVGGLIAFGAVQLIRAREHAEFCGRGVTVIDEVNEPGGGIDPCVFDPPALGFASAGLSWGFSIPLLAAAGLLFVRGARVRADARRFDRSRVAVVPWGHRRSGGATFVLRF